MTAADAVGAQQILPVLLARATDADLQAISGEAAAINNAANAINHRLAEIEKSLATLDAQITALRQLAVALKAVSLFGGIFILSSLAPNAVPYVSIAIAIASGVDLLLGNHRRLIGFLDKKNGLEELKESVADADIAATAVLRLAGKDLREAVRKYADFMQQLQAGVYKGYKEVQAASRKLERDVVAALDVAQTAGNAGGGNS